MKLSPRQKVELLSRITVKVIQEHKKREVVEGHVSWLTQLMKLATLKKEFEEARIWKEGSRGEIEGRF